MHEPESGSKIDDLLSGTVEEAWLQCLDVWKNVGRIEDLPRAIRRPHYLPGRAKLLGLRFAERFYGDFRYIIAELIEGDSFVSLCAFEILDFMAPLILQEFPEALATLGTITVPIPEPVATEIRSDHLYAEFKGSMIGEFLIFEYGHIAE